MKKHNSTKSGLCAVLLASALTCGTSNAAVIITADVTAATTTSATVDFTFSGTVDEAVTTTFLFLMFGNDPVLVPALQGPVNGGAVNFSYTDNTVIAGAGTDTLNSGEIRFGGGNDRIGFRFANNSVTQNDVMSGSATYTFNVFNGDTLESSDFAGFDIRTATNGTTVGSTVAAVPEPSSTALLGLGGLALILRRRR